jgi:hypothetical protein
MLALRALIQSRLTSVSFFRSFFRFVQFHGDKNE